ncbi:hypothetical protein M899_0625 [Bacteriovorax sp. BSW11_IV]|uniref:hypothetical protein n=1 Tax=Bacteriovorax sp. BSW11_IV TaxID=1353529 RepID=UPI00038A0D9B|nr:hypothetical protein [Bacteriovorax sp. BSW11_IV]EQC48874.1 hypothetical protein M899_0625 [Bacteriovorax sp. BSW11_IV]
MITKIQPSFTTLQLQKDIKTGKTNPYALQIAGELDKQKNVYQSDLWHYSTPKSHYKNTFVENQTSNYLKRLNTY